jgi:hypothetical protein
MSRGRIARWMLEEVGKPYQTEILDYATTMKAPAYLAINPMGKVPAIRHGEVVVTEAGAICAYLADAYLAYANLARAYLARALNVPDGTEKKDPPEPYVRAVKPKDYVERALRYRKSHPSVPVVPNLDAKILAVIESGKGQLEMSNWHTCETTHCRAGWAITFAGPDGKALENKHGPATAGRMIYLASTGRAPHFFATNDRAMEDIKACAAEQTNHAYPVDNQTPKMMMRRSLR